MKSISEASLAMENLATGKLYTDGTDIYVFGSGSLAKI